MSKLKFICIAHNQSGLCLVYDDGSFINIGGPMRTDGTTADYIEPARPRTNRRFWEGIWPTVIDVDS